ncbi:MAG: hypothetical protein ACI4EO_09430 [Blautia sp.]
MNIRHIRNIFAVSLITGTLFLTGCGIQERKGIREAVKEELGYLEHPDTETIQQYLHAEDLFPDEKNSSQPIDSAITEIFTEFYKDFSYKVSDIEYDDTKATAVITITNLDTKALARDYSVAALQEHIKEDANPIQVSFSLYDSYLLLGETLKANDYDLTESSFPAEFEKKNGTWKMITDDSLENELTGNFLTYMADSSFLSPEDVVKIHFDTIKEFDSEQLNIYLSLDSMLDLDDTYSSAVTHAIAQQIHQFFDYEIKDTKIEKQNATVTVSITSADFISIINAYHKHLEKWMQTSEAMEAGMFGRREKEREALLESIKNNESTTSKEVKITLINDGTNWKMQMNNEVAEAILGGINDAVLSETNQNTNSEE